MKIIIFFTLFFALCYPSHSKAKNIDSLETKELRKILALSELKLEDSFIIEEVRFNESGVPCVFKVSISDNDHQQLLIKIKNSPNVTRKTHGFIFRTRKPMEGTIYINLNETWIVVNGCPPYGTSEIMAVLKQVNLTLVDDFFIFGMSGKKGKNCSFRLQISEQDKMLLIDKIRENPNFQEDSLKVIIHELNGKIISVFKSKPFLDIINCFDIPIVDYSIHEETWFEKVKIPDNVKYFEPRLNQDQLKDEVNLNIVLDSTNFIKKPFDFVLINGSEPGKYNFEIGLGKIDYGAVFMKAFEYTTNHSIGNGTLFKESITIVKNKSKALKIFESYGSFTISDGKDHIKYLAKFEVWYQTEGKLAKKIAEKVYKIEGWER